MKIRTKLLIIVLNLHPVFIAQGADPYSRYSQPDSGRYRTYDDLNRDVYRHTKSTLEDGVYTGSYYREPYIGIGPQGDAYSYDNNLPLNEQVADPSSTPQYPYTAADIIE